MSGTYKQQIKYRARLFAKSAPKGMRRCRLCLLVKPIGEYTNQKPRNPGGLSRRCAQCREYQREYMRAERARHTEEQRMRHIRRAKELRDGRKKLIIAHYGGKCACCGTAEIEFLTVDHIVPIGSKKRKENGDWGNRFYLNIIRRDFPTDYRCLCWNCNWSYGCYGYCPHQPKRS